jgi:hypothetical protein
VIAEAELVVGVIADGPDQPPTAKPREHRPGEIRELFRVAIPARQQKDERIVRQLVDRELAVVGGRCVRFAAVRDQKVVGDFERTGRRKNAGADIAEQIAEVARRHLGAEAQPVIAQQIGGSRRMDAQHQRHRSRLKAVECDGVASPDLHGSPSS